MTGAEKPNILLVDDNKKNLLCLENMLHDSSFDLSINTVHALSGKQALRCALETEFALMLLDVEMPDMNGFELAEIMRKNERTKTVPIIFVTGHGDVPMAVQAMKKGAWGFLEKPFNDEVLIGDINRAFAADAASRHVEKQRQMIANRIKQLTPRENEIMKKIVSGAHNKTIAFDLGLSQRTVELHRSHVMQKMRARSLAQLVRMSLLSEELGESE